MKESWWLIVPCCVPGHASISYQEHSAIVQVEDQETLLATATLAARHGVEEMRAEASSIEDDYLESVYAVPLDMGSMIPFTKDHGAYRRGEWDCCGGPFPWGHSGYCPTKTDAAEVTTTAELPDAEKVRVSDDPERNGRTYEHRACPGHDGGPVQWTEPLDDVPMPADAECPECVQTLPTEFVGVVVREPRE